MKDKASLRQHYRKLLKGQSTQERLRKSLEVARQFWKLPAIQKAGNILFYASMPGEVDTLAMIQQALVSGKRVSLPVVEENQKKLTPTLILSMEELHITKFGVAEPDRNPQKTVALDALDAVVVPGLAFDGRHNRLGRGLGYYDRFLSVLPQTAATIGLAFDFQITESLPVDAHDVRLQQIIVG
jgi:5-formyltetrahydrofolate cyclo-ligase